MTNGGGKRTLDAATVARQGLRVRRLLMSVLSYVATLSVVAFCAYQGMLAPIVAVQYAGMVAAVVLATYAAFRFNFNLRFSDPSLTSFQSTISILPALWVMYHIDGVQVRAALLMLSTVPALYAVLALTTWQMLGFGGFFVAAYSVLLLALWQRSPHAFDATSEAIVLLAFVVVMLQFAVLGGFISRLRQNLRRRNLELNSAMAELNQALEEIQELANRDPLTGVFNRRHLFDVLRGEVERCNRGQMALSVCMFDIDHFKQVNDVHGHLAGDRVLRRVTEAVERNLRSIDCFGRYGGEEFLLILPQTPLDGAVTKAERVRRDVEALRFPEIAPDFRITISIGVAQYRTNDLLDQLVARADKALYAAKKAGRNRIATGEPLPMPADTDPRT